MPQRDASARPKLSVGVIARDKFSLAAAAVRSAFELIPPDTEVLVLDSGYPRQILGELREAADGRAMDLVPVERFAPTNVAWNAFVGRARGRFLLCLENDVVMQPESVRRLLRAARAGLADVVVPVVDEIEIGRPHFDPPLSEMTELDDGSIQQRLVRRPKHGLIPSKVDRRVAHLERHCFLMSRQAALSLGKLDERMYCRTDLDMSLALRAAGLTIAIVADAKVLFQKQPPSEIDRELFDRRWDIDRVAFANARLIDKWRLQGFKTTINHAHRMRALLTDAS